MGHVTCEELKRNVYKVLVGKPDGGRLIGRTSYEWVDNFKLASPCFIIQDATQKF